MRGLHRVAALALTSLALASAPVPAQTAAPPVRGDATARTANIADHVAEASRRFGVPERWIWAVMRVESNGDRGAVSPAGAMGLMQIMPGTWAILRVRYRLGNDPFEPPANILGGTAYLREMHDRFGSPGFLAAYNAGPGRYQDYLARRRPLPAETLAYLDSLAPVVGGSAPVRAAVAPPPDRNAWMRAALFPVRPDSVEGDDEPAVDALDSASSPPQEERRSEPRETLFVALGEGLPR